LKLNDDRVEAIVRDGVIVASTYHAISEIASKLAENSADFVESSADFAENSANLADLSDSKRSRLRAPRHDMESDRMFKFSATIVITTESIVTIVLLLHAIGRL
jgi:hypothetical protein